VVAFPVWFGLVTSTWPRADPERYLHHSSRFAVPQYISGRTSYLHVRLAFHPYPQLIPLFCNTGECAPRRPVTVASRWPWVAHVVSGQLTTTARPVQARLPCGSPPLAEVNQAMASYSPDHSSIGTPSALAPAAGEWPLTAGKYEVSGSLSSPSRGAFHLSLTVLVHYRSLKVLSLGGWSPLLPTNSPGFVVLRNLTSLPTPVATGLSPSLVRRSNRFASAG
jgi:hypothetical protein